MKRQFKILLVDDDPIDQMFLKKALSNELENLEFICSLKGHTALELIGNGEYVPDLIILDLNMPGLSGIDVLKKIRSDSRFKRIPIIMMSTSNAQSDVDAAYNSCVSTYIQKPDGLSGYRQTAKTIADYWCRVALLPS